MGSFLFQNRSWLKVATILGSTAAWAVVRRASRRTFVAQAGSKRRNILPRNCEPRGRVSLRPGRARFPNVIPVPQSFARPPFPRAQIAFEPFLERFAPAMNQ